LTTRSTTDIATETTSSQKSDDPTSPTILPSTTFLDSVIHKSSESSKISNQKSTMHQLRDVGEGTIIVALADGIVRKIGSQTKATHSDIVIAWIDPCQHPTMIAGLCAVCGTKVSSDEPVPEEGGPSPITPSLSPGTIDSYNMNENMTLMTVSGMTVKVSESESKRMAIEDTKRLQAVKKLSLVLDLDHTLLHATADPRAEQQCRHRTDIRHLVLPYMMPDNAFSTMHPPRQFQPTLLQQHFVKLRPHVKEFLEQAMENFELGVYTAGTRDYAEEVTILLSRHLVGAERDQMELERLRQELIVMEHKYQLQQLKIGNNDLTNKKIDVGEETTAKNALENVDTVIEGKNTGIKRKRVQFDTPPSSTKTDETSLEDIENLRAEIRNAESLEQQAQDLRRKLFGSRVMSRTESGESGRHVKSLKRIFPCGGSMAAVIDDREDVWANAEEMTSRRVGEPPENLLLVRPYHWYLFQGFADVNNTSGTDFSPVDTTSQVETDEQLLWTSKVLKKLHHMYYDREASSRRTVPEILEEMRSEVLKGCVIVLSGLVPLSKQQNVDQNQARPPFVRYAESLGATVKYAVSEEVTHVVAANDGTDKILSARKINGCKIVKPSWLIECYWSMTRRDESSHLLETTVKQARFESKVIPEEIYQPIYHEKRSKSGVPTQGNEGSNDDDNDDDDEDFAAELEKQFLNIEEDEDDES
jgi:RNA polymerase II subunit A-like phosphatase